MIICNTDSKHGLSGLGQRIKCVREQRGLTQVELSQKTGLHAAQVSHFETGNRLPCAKNLRVICIALNVSADYLLDLRRATERRTR